MKKFTYYLIAFFFAAFSWQGMAQVLNQNATWPNANWTVTGNYNTDPNAFESDPTITSNFAFDDDDAGGSHEDNIAAESPIIDLTAAHTAGETLLSISGDYVYNYSSNDELKFQYWDADSSIWTDWGFGFTQDTASAPTDNFCGGTSETYTSSDLDISSFTTIQLAGFKYRISYDDDPAGTDWNYGFCFQSPTIVSATPPTCPDVTNITASNFTAPSNADLSWDAATGATGYNWEIQPQGTAQGDAAVVQSGSESTNTASAISLTSGTDYTLYVQTDCGSGTLGNWMSYDFTFVLPPANDLCGDAINITCGNSYTGSTATATETDEETTTCGTSQGAPGVWFKYAGDDNNVTVDLSLSSFDTKIQVWSGSCGSLTCVGGNDDGGTGATSLLTFGADTGTDYYVYVYGYSTNTGNFDLAVSCVPYPVCPDVMNIAASNFTAPGNADLSWDVATGATGYNWEIQPQGTAQGDAAVVGSGSESTNTASATSLVSGTDYTLYVQTDCGSGALGTWMSYDFTFVLPPANDDCADATSLTVNADLACGAVESGTLLGATDSGVSDNGTGTPNNDVWFSFMATADTHEIKMLNKVANNGSTDLVHEILSGDCATLVSVNISDPDTSTVSGLTIGDTYYVRVFSYYTSATDVTFDVCVGTNPPPPANDDACNAEMLTLNAAPTVATNVGATGQTNEPSPTCWSDSTVNSVWFSFVSNGMDVAVTTDFDTPLNDTSIAVYSTTDCADFTTYTQVGCDTDSGNAGSFGWNSIAKLTSLTAGDTYYIQVEGYSTKTGEFNIQIVDNDSFIMPYPIVPSAEGTPCDVNAATFTAHLAGDGTTDSGMDGSCNGTSTGLDRFYSWTATTEGLIWNDGAGNPGIVIRDTAGNEITCEGTFAADDVLLTGWAIGDDLIIQIYDFQTADVDVTFCLTEAVNFPPQFTTTAVEDCANGQFTVNLDVTTLGGASTVTVADGTTTFAGVGAGVQNFGPYPVGTSVDFTVTSDDDATMTTTETVTYTCPPANDNICDAIAITIDATSASDAFTNLGATAETNEPVGGCFANGIGGSVWFTFVAPASGAVNVTTDIAGGTNTDTEVAVYAAPTDCTDMTTLASAIGCNQDVDLAGGNYLSTAFVNGLTSGDTYYVQVDNWSGSFEGGTFGLEVQEVPMYNPVFTATTTADCANSQFSVAIDVTDLGGSATVTVTDSTTSFTGVGTGIQNFGPYASGTSVDFTVTSDDDITYTASETVTFTCPPANDNICDAIALTIDTPSAGDAYTTLGATAETNEPTGDCFNFGSLGTTVWFTFTAPMSGNPVSVTTDIAGGSNTDTMFAIFEAPTDCTDASTLGTQVGCDDDSGTVITANSITLLNNLTAGQLYYILVDTYSATTAGTFGIEVNEITVSVPDCVTMDTPLNGATDVLSPVALTWTPATTGDSADSYNVYISINGAAEFLFNTYTDTFTPALGLEPGIAVAWRVVPVNAAGENTACTTVFTFSSVVGTDDYDGDGVDNSTEYTDGTDMADPCSPTQVAGYTGYDATNTIWGAADCDGDGQNNAQEDAGGSDPYDAGSTVSVEELKAVGFEYYPNPVNSNLTVKANENITSIAIFNMLGQQVKQVNPSSLNAQIDMTSLANGTYFIKATVGEKVGTFKIIKK